MNAGEVLFTLFSHCSDAVLLLFLSSFSFSLRLFHINLNSKHFLLEPQWS